MGRVFIFGMFGLILIGLVFLAVFLAPVGIRWFRKVVK